jgi:hypothetical protein
MAIGRDVYINAPCKSASIWAKLRCLPSARCGVRLVCKEDTENGTGKQANHADNQPITNASTPQAPRRTAVISPLADAIVALTIALIPLAAAFAPGSGFYGGTGLLRCSSVLAVFLRCLRCFMGGSCACVAFSQPALRLAQGLVRFFCCLNCAFAVSLKPFAVDLRLLADLPILPIKKGGAVTPYILLAWERNKKTPCILHFARPLFEKLDAPQKKLALLRSDLASLTALLASCAVSWIGRRPFLGFLSLTLWPYARFFL